MISRGQDFVGVFARLVLCIFVFGFCLYSYIDKQNELTHLRIQLPHLAKELKGIREENTRLQYEIDRFENPEHLMELARHEQYRHLKHPLAKEIITLQEGVAFTFPSQEGKAAAFIKSKPTLATGAK